MARRPRCSHCFGTFGTGASAALGQGPPLYWDHLGPRPLGASTSTDTALEGRPPLCWNHRGSSSIDVKNIPPAALKHGGIH